MQESAKKTALAFLELVAAGSVREAFRRCVGPGFRHHNPYFLGDAASLMAGMEENAASNPEKSLEVVSALEEGDRVAVLSRVRHEPGGAGVAVVHIFRFEAGSIVELWDVAQAVPENTINENGMF